MNTINTKRQRIIAVIISILLVFITFFSVFYMNRELEHDCTGKDCPICETIHVAVQTLKQLNDGIIESAIVIMGIVNCAMLFISMLFFISNRTLVTQRVRMNN